MIDRHHRGADGRPLPRLVLAIGAVLAAVFAAALTFTGVDLLMNGCSCDEPLYPDWAWAVMLALAVPFYAAALTLAVRLLRGARHPEHRERGAPTTDD
jgi:hypothetical protein